MNANPLAAFIFDAEGTVQQEIVKKDVDCIIAEVEREGMYMRMCVCVCMCVCVKCGDSLTCIHLAFAALKRQFPFPSLSLANCVIAHREEEFLRGKICLFRAGNCTMWIAREHRAKVERWIVQKAKAVTENSGAPCVVRKEMPIDVKEAEKMLATCEIGRVTVMQYGQKTDFGNKVVQWALKNVRESCLCVNVPITDGRRLSLKLG